ncbi:MAG: S8 family serine peptidase [Anaerolineaceae bacterium]|nr:S8 family serine peptidase [Anaerolineaceae bacterium]
MSVEMKNKHKLSPRLRMFANGDEVVNTLRAEQTASLVVQNAELAESVPSISAGQMQMFNTLSFSLEAKPPTIRRRKLKEITNDVLTNVFIQLANDTGGPADVPDVLKDLDPTPIRKDNIVIATIPLSLLPELLASPKIISVENPETIRFFQPVTTAVVTNPPEAGNRCAATPAAQQQDVLIGIIDVQGFDFAHPDFLDAEGKTRFVSIWDQGGEGRKPPERFDYGSELTQEMMNYAIGSEEQYQLPPTELEPQSEMIPGSHGTHVASIAAGNRGVCPGARIAAVLLALPKTDQERRKSFYDSTRLAHAVDYLFCLGKELNLPVSINISLGTNGYSHDATSLTSRWLDFQLATPGRSICVAAGNAGQEARMAPDDWGFTMGRIHTSGKFEAPGEEKILYWEVLGDGIMDISENELEIWYSPRDHIAVQVKAPGASEWTSVVEPRQYIENMRLPNNTFLSVYNETFMPANGLNYIACYLSPLFSKKQVVGIASGSWQVRLFSRELRDGRYHAWIERDDARRAGVIGGKQAWAFPSFFGEQTFTDMASISSLACTHSVVAVANLDETSSKVHHTSSQGPTRDEREKPDIAAPGTNIIAANGFHPGQCWVSMTGTSMASPYAAGVIGLMLAADRQLTAAQITGILHRTSTPLSDQGNAWRNDAGFGVINPAACLDEVLKLRTREDINP